MIMLPSNEIKRERKLRFYLIVTYVVKNPDSNNFNTDNGMKVMTLISV